MAQSETGRDALLSLDQDVQCIGLGRAAPDGSYAPKILASLERCEINCLGSMQCDGTVLSNGGGDRSYRRILVTGGVRRQRFEFAI
jgi:hypothetical protein